MFEDTWKKKEVVKEIKENNQAIPDLDHTASEDIPAEYDCQSPKVKSNAKNLSDDE